MANARGPIRTGDPAGATTCALTSSAPAQSAVVTAPQQAQVLDNSRYSVITGPGTGGRSTTCRRSTPTPLHRSTNRCIPCSVPVRSARPDPGCPTTTGTPRDPLAACRACDRTVPATTAASRASCSTANPTTAVGRSSTNPHPAGVPAPLPGPSTSRSARPGGRSIRPARRPTLEARPPSNRSQINCPATPFHDHMTRRYTQVNSYHCWGSVFQRAHQLVSGRSESAATLSGAINSETVDLVEYEVADTWPAPPSDLQQAPTDGHEPVIGALMTDRYRRRGSSFGLNQGIQVLGDLVDQQPARAFVEVPDPGPGERPGASTRWEGIAEQHQDLRGGMAGQLDLTRMPDQALQRTVLGSCSDGEAAGTGVVLRRAGDNLVSAQAGAGRAPRPAGRPAGPRSEVSDGPATFRGGPAHR